MRPQSTRKETERKLGAHSQCGPGEARHIGTWRRLEVQDGEGSESESEEGDKQAQGGQRGRGERRTRTEMRMRTRTTPTRRPPTMQDEKADPEEGQRRGARPVGSSLSRMMGAKQQTLDGELRKLVETRSERHHVAHCPSQGRQQHCMSRAQRCCKQRLCVQ